MLKMREGRIDQVAPGNVADPRASQTRALMVEQSLPMYADLAIDRRIFAANTGAGTEIVPVAVIPTTAAAWALYNGYEDNTHLVVLQMSCHSVSGTLGLGMTLLGGLSPTKQAAVVATYASSVKHALFSNEVVSRAIFGQGVTLAAAPVWIPLNSGDQVSAVSVGSGLVAKVDGLFVVAPGYCLGGTILAPLGTNAKFAVTFVWAEVKLNPR